LNVSVGPRLIAITDTERGSAQLMLQQLTRLAEGAIPGSVQVQLRDRQLPVRERLLLGRQLRSLTRRHGQLFFVNDRLDLAALLEADGVHLSEASVQPEDARAFGRLQGQAWQISAACHTPEGIASARSDAVLLSPVAKTRKGRPALGAAGVLRARQAHARRGPELGGCSIYVLGGVTRHDARHWLDAGADGVALIGELFELDAVPALLRALGIRR
jgi:thiamine-phosphate pyrophosphorylase